MSLSRDTAWRTCNRSVRQLFVESYDKELLMDCNVYFPFPHVRRASWLLSGVVVWLNFAVSPARATPVKLYASSEGPGTDLFSVNLATGTAVSIGPTDAFEAGLAFRRSNGVLYGSSSTLYTINVKTGAATTVAPLPSLMVGLAFSLTDQLYAVGNSGNTLSLYTLNPATGSVLSNVPLTGTVSSGGLAFPGEIEGITFGPDGTLYGIGYGLYSINPLSGVAHRITPLGKDVTGPPVGDGFLSIDYGSDGVLRGIAWLYANATVHAELYTINPSTGLGNLVGPTGYLVGGLASSPPIPLSSVPEPSAMVLAAVAVGLILFHRQRRKPATTPTAIRSSRSTPPE
jgi:hypothetical protein